MKHIKQRTNHDCVLVCIAMLGNFSYEQAKELVGPWYWDLCGVNGYVAEEMFDDLGWKTRSNFHTELFSELKHDALIIIKPPYHNHNHAVVWDYQQQRILCPSVRAYPYITTPSWHASIKFYQKHLVYITEIIERS